MNEVPEIFQKDTLILGCGNILFGDDGFGPEVIHFLEENYLMPDDVATLDVGTGVREILFTIALSERKPKRIIIIDAFDIHKKPGEIFSIPVEDLPENKTDDFSLHQLPTSNLLKELKDLAGIEVILLGAQPDVIPEAVKPALSSKLQKAVPRMGKYLISMTGITNARVAHR